MNRIDERKIIHELSQPHIKMASSTLTNHLERTGANMVTRMMVDSLILALKDKNELVTELYAENERLREVSVNGSMEQ
jgi:hypothetical protein